MNYEVIYSVGILDDVHNFFPALLYDSGRFTNIQEVFHYIRNQMNTRFNLFAYGASRARAAQPERGAAQQRPAQYERGGAQQRAPHTVLRTTAAESIPTLNAAPDFLSATMLLNMMNSLDLLQPVVVAPSAQVVATSTEIISGETLPDATVCTICQDTISRTDTARKITTCGHVYHQTCIDTWFHSSVFCPTCRHDIRTLH